jgi:metal-dependent amidase/aminoacylase/carboxypeptidase family protein
VVLGCPAEEGGENGSAKASYVKAGIIDEIDIALRSMCTFPIKFNI